jgi:hypothetical protein
MKYGSKDGTFGEFKCIHCKTVVTVDMGVSGVINRNHCPYCLWSKHLDLFESGDRLAACKGAMKPVGLTIKKTRKKYGSEKQGEMMLIHQCVECGRVSINRIAADDISDNVMDVYRQWLELDEAQREAISQGEVEALDEDDEELVRSRLFGIGEEDE